MSGGKQNFVALTRKVWLGSGVGFLVSLLVLFLLFLLLVALDVRDSSRMDWLLILPILALNVFGVTTSVRLVSWALSDKSVLWRFVKIILVLFCSIPLLYFCLGFTFKCL